MKKVAIFDLRSNDAWDFDFCLVEHTLINSTNMDSIMYFDKCYDPVYFSGEEWEAQTYYSNYCMKRNLQLITYDDMERIELDALKEKIVRGAK